MENWKAITGYEGLYEVSDEGRVRSLRNDLIVRACLRGKYLCLNLHRDGVRSMKAVHHLVLEAFVAGRPDGLVAAHLDGDRTNNRLENLRWVTPAENEAHKVAHGTSSHGRRSTQARLTDAQANIIREANALGLSMAKLGLLVGLSTNTIHKIVKGRYYNHA